MATALQTLPVGSLEPNAFGVYDVIGNVAEWTLDCMNLSYLDAPADGSAWSRGICSSRMTRGGSWFTGTREIRLPARFNLKNGDRNDFTGARLTYTLYDRRLEFYTLAYRNESSLAAIRDRDNLFVITRSDKGSVIYRRGQTVKCPATPVETVVDTTGAGDAYSAGFLYGWANGWSLEDAAKLGTHMATSVIQRVRTDRRSRRRCAASTDPARRSPLRPC